MISGTDNKTHSGIRTSPGGTEHAPGTCILCGARALREAQTFSRFLDLPGHSEARVQECASCSMLFLDPYPDADQLERLYSEAYFNVDNAQGLDGDGKQVKYEDVAELRKAKFQATIDLLKRFAAPPARLLDVGAATGEFLHIAQRNGYDVAGLELSAFAAAKAREQFGFDLFVGPLDAYPTERTFDVVHLSHVMEHLVDPHGSIEKMAQLVSRTGVIYIEVPFQWNWVEQLHFLRGHRQKFSAFSVHHRSFFRPETLRAFFLKHGFECRHLTLTPPHRYPVPNLPARAKRSMWRGLSMVGQGLLIEAVFSRIDQSVPPEHRANGG